MLLLLLKLSNGQLMVNVNEVAVMAVMAAAAAAATRNSGHSNRSNRSNLIDAGDSRRGKGRAEKE